MGLERGVGSCWTRGLLLAAAVALALGAAGCGGDDEAPVVLVDYSHDAFATQFILFFPEHLKVHPGGRIIFEQHWTGEPHTVTFGTDVDAALEVARPLVDEYGHLPDEELPDWVIPAYMEAMGGLPGAFGPEPEDEEGGPPEDEQPDEGALDGEMTAEDEPLFEEIDQAMAQPCVIEAGEEYPERGEPCENRELAPFKGTERYYNSGIIPYEGPGGNRFEMTLDDDIEPGTYRFYCAVHGAFQAGVLEVVPTTEEIPSPRQANVELRELINRRLAPYGNVFDRAQEQEYEFAGQRHDWNYAGLRRENSGSGPSEGLINEFVPREVTAVAGEPITWRIFGPHSISFNVPEYFPIIEIDDDGTVKYNEAVWAPAGGAPEPPPWPEIDQSEPLVMDAGTFDGEGYWSSGVLSHELYVEYTLRVTTPGTYRFACLIHPPMVGTLRVTE